MASARLARLVLALYPLAYRRRYGEEMAALIEDAGASPAAVGDLLRGAVRAHLRPGPAVAAAVGHDDRLRLGLSSVLLCWVLFAAAGLGLYKTTESRPLAGPAAPGLLGGLHLAIQILAGAASLAVVLGSAPLVFAALRQAASRPDSDAAPESAGGRARDETRRAARLAVGCVATFAVATAALVLIANAGAGLPDGVDALILGAWSMLALACGVGCALAARRGLFAIEVSPRALRLARAGATVVAAAMVAIVILVALYLVDLEAAAPTLAGAPNGPLGVPDVAAFLALQLIAMVALAVPATVSAARAYAR